MGWEGISPSAPEWTGRDLNSRVQPFNAELPATSTMPTWRSYQTDLPALSHTKHEQKTFKHYASRTEEAIKNRSVDSNPTRQPILISKLLFLATSYSWTGAGGINALFRLVKDSASKWGNGVKRVFLISKFMFVIMVY